MPDATGYAAVKALLPLITPYSITDDTAGAKYYALAVEQQQIDAPRLTETQAQTAQCYWIAHLMASHDGKTGITSEHLGQWSASFSTTAAGTDIYYAQYKQFISDIAPQTFAGISAVVKHCDAQLADDLSLDGYRSDANGV